MDSPGLNSIERSELFQLLQDRREAIVDVWHATIAGTSFTPLPAEEVRRRLDDLTSRAITLLLSERFDRGEAQEIGSALGSMHYLSPEALGRTQELLARQLLEDLSDDYALVVQARMATLLGEIGAGFFGRARDIILREQEEIKGALLSERKRAEEALRRSEASLAEAQQIAHLGHWDYDWERDTLFWSEEIFRIFGVTEEEFGGTFEDFFRFVHPEDVGLLQQVAGGDAAASGDPIATEHRIIRPDGEVRVVYQRLRFIFDESRPPLGDAVEHPGSEEEISAAKQYLNYVLHMLGQSSGQRFAGRPVRVVGTVQDITERKRAEDELRAARDELELRVRERTAELAQSNEELRAEIARRRRSEEAQSILVEAGAVLSSSLDYRATLSDVAHLVVPRLADWSDVHVLEGDGSLKSVAVAHADPEKVAWAQGLQERYPSHPEAPQGVPNVVRTGRAEFYPRITDEMLVAAARDAEHLQMMREAGVTSVIIVPLAARGRTLGAITLVSAESGRIYGDTDLEFARELARLAALAVDNARLYEEAKREITERRRAEEALRSSRNELEIVLQGVTDGITAQDPTGRLVYANEAAATFVGYPSAQAMVEASVPEFMRKFEVLDESGRPFPPEDLPGRRALRGEQNPPERLLCYRGIETGKTRWALVRAAPVFDEQGRVLFAVNIFRDVTEQRRTEETLREVREAERARIARDLHDRALQDLSYALSEAQLTRRLSESQELGNRLDKVVEAMQRAGRALRVAVYDLRQEVSAERSFVRAVKTLIDLNRRMQPGCEVELTVRERFPQELPGTVSRELLSIVQEALTNTRRHSDATRVVIALWIEGDDLVADVSDDGRGFGPATPPGFGFESMQERAASLGGELEVESELGEGTRVRFRAPIQRLLQKTDGTEPGAGWVGGAI